MNKIEFFLLHLIISISSVGLFWWLESGFSLRNGDELAKSVIFAVALFVILTNKYKRFVLLLSLVLMGLMVILYLFWQLSLSNLFGSIGFGLFIIFSLSLLPDLIKSGFVEKF